MTARDDYPHLAKMACIDVAPCAETEALQVLAELDRLRPLAVIGEQVRIDCAYLGNSWWRLGAETVERLDPSTVVITVKDPT